MGASIVPEVGAMREEVEEGEGSFRRERLKVEERGNVGGRNGRKEASEGGVFLPIWKRENG